ncbi:MAG: 2,4-dihydroxyhept-2-ene-1,7-dioic acid aldolase [Proteobacteria bacterium]|nr:2,4-dihydroxyhept-2-ene-1,7-dioic acid aldolase [Pseudomonadota bacterium]
MRKNKLRELLNAGKPSFGTRVHSSWPSIAEVIGHTGLFDYVEFIAENAPFDLYALDNFCRAVELFDMSAMIKVDAEHYGFMAQRGIGAGFQSVNFADCRSAVDVRERVKVTRPDTPEHGGRFGAGMRRFAYMGHDASPQYVQALQDVVIVIMIEKQSAVEQLDEILSVKGIDMIQWGPSDYSMNIGMAGAKTSPEIKAVERKVFETANKYGIPARAEIASVDQAKYYLDMGVQHFNLGLDISILFNWLKENGNALRKVVSDTQCPNENR